MSVYVTFLFSKCLFLPPLFICGWVRWDSYLPLNLTPTSHWYTEAYWWLLLLQHTTTCCCEISLIVVSCQSDSCQGRLSSWGGGGVLLPLEAGRRRVFDADSWCYLMWIILSPIESWDTMCIVGMLICFFLFVFQPLIKSIRYLALL